jgi:fibronectin type 3 domain-containing protein
VKWPALPVSPDAPDNKVRYSVYEVAGSSEMPLTKPPIAETQYVDARLTWGATRCYVVRSVHTVDALSVESEATPPACVTLTDTFPPAAPKGLQAVATEGVINLIWDANTEADLDGYILLRGVSPGEKLAPISPSPIRETAFQDHVPAGVRYIYAVEAVDKAGNTSQPSERIEESAR